MTLTQINAKNGLMIHRMRREDLYPVLPSRVTPVDQDENLDKLINFFGEGVLFTSQMAANVLRCSVSAFRTWILDRQFWLQDCPEGIQIVSKRGSLATGGGYKFVRGEE